MKKEKKIPTIGPNLYGKFLFDEVEWVSPFPSVAPLFHINRLEDVSQKINFPLPPHRKITNDIILITKGESIRSKGLNDYHFKKNQLFIMPAFQVTAHDFMSPDVEGFFVNYSPDILSEFSFVIKKYPFLKFAAHPIIQLPDHAMPNILNLLFRMEEIYLNFKKGDLDVEVSYLLTLFAEINKHAELESLKSDKNTATILTEKYKNFLSQHIYDKQTVQEYADMLYVTPNHLNKCVKNTLNKTAKNLLNEMLILESKSLLKYSNLSIAEVAAKLCRSTASNFSRFFKHQTGITPKQYLES